MVDVEPQLRAQVIKQMNKLMNVLQATDLTDSPAVKREMVLLRVRAPLASRTAILKEAEIFGARVVDSSTEGFALEATGDSEKLDEFIDVMRSYGEIEVTRSGAIAVSLEAKKLRLAPPVPRNAARATKQTKNWKRDSRDNHGKTILRKRRRSEPVTKARRSPSSVTEARATRMR